MKLKIKHSSFFEKRILEITPSGVIYYRAAVTSGKRRFRFDQIDAILLAPDGVLSFQVMREVFSLKIKPAKAGHQQVVEAFLHGVRGTCPAG